MPVIERVIETGKTEAFENETEEGGRGPLLRGERRPLAAATR